jgi:septum site-determining protein MinD
VVRVVSVHSFRGGTGKSNLTANLAVRLADRGAAIGVVDTDIQSPGIHVLFGLAGNAVDLALNDHLHGEVPIEDIARDVTPEGVAGRVELVPASVDATSITRILRDGYDAERLVRALGTFVEARALDVLLIDTHPGLGEETLLALVVSDTVLVVLRPDQQDYEGTGILAEVADGLEVPHRALVVNKVPPSLPAEEVRRRVEDAYGAPVLAVLPHDDEVMTLGSRRVFSLDHPDHPFTLGVGAIAAELDGAAAR